VLDDGPGPTPQILINHATRKLSARHPGVDVRARRAFVAGYWARIALDTDTPYRPADPIPPLKYYYWVVLKCPAFEGAALFRDRVDFGRAIENDVDNCIYEAFPSFTEVEIFCCGAKARSQIGNMEKATLRFLSDGEPSLIIWRPSQDLRKVGTLPATFAVPLMSRSGGLLFAVPSGLLDENVLLDAYGAEAKTVLGLKDPDEIPEWNAEEGLISSLSACHPQTSL